LYSLFEAWDSFGKLLLPGYDVNLAYFTFFGELLFMLWLLFKGGKDQPQANHAPASPEGQPMPKD